MTTESGVKCYGKPEEGGQDQRRLYIETGEKSTPSKIISEAKAKTCAGNGKELASARLQEV